MYNWAQVISLVGVFLFLSCFQLSAQNLDLFNEIYLDSSLLKKYSIRSLTIHSQYDENGLSDSSFTVPFKLKELSFSEEGEITFARSVPLHDHSILLGEKGTKWEWFEYDSLQRTIQTRINHGRNIQENAYTYNTANQVTKKVLSYKGIVNTTEVFEWKDGKMIHSEMTSNSSWTHTYGSDGRLCRLESGTHLTETVSTRYLNILDRSIVSYRSGKMVATGRTMKDVFNNRLLHILSLDGKLDTVHLINAKLDEHSNIIYFYQKDFPSKGKNTKSPRPYSEAMRIKMDKERIPFSYPRVTIFEIQNTYDIRGLLIEQKYIQIDPYNPTKKKVISIQRLVYETTDLPASSFSILNE